MTKQERAARARESKLNKQINKLATELTGSYISKFGESLTFEQARKKILTVMSEDSINARTAFTRIKAGRSFTSEADHFRQVIMKNLNHNVGTKNRLRWALSQTDGTKYKQTLVDLSKFTYDSTLKALIYQDIVIWVQRSNDSLSADMLNITYGSETFEFEYND